MALAEEERCATCGSGRPAERRTIGGECSDPYHAAAWDDGFGTTCVDCGEAITDETPTVPTADGDLLHLGCGEPCVCHTAFTCLAHEHAG